MWISKAVFLALERRNEFLEDRVRELHDAVLARTWENIKEGRLQADAHVEKMAEIQAEFPDDPVTRTAEEVLRS